MTPVRCSVLLALPADRAQFDAVARGDELPDYGRHLIRGETPAVVWDRRYSRVSAAIGQLTAAASEAGACVVQRARLADLAVASSKSDVLIVVAHWRDWAVSAHDFTANALTVHRRLQTAGFGDITAIPERRTPSLAEIAASLNTAIENGEVVRRCAPDVATGGINRRLSTTLGRDALDELLGSLIAPGNRVELYGGLHTPGEFDAAIDVNFSGELDLSTCSSFALATLISMRRGSRVSLIHTLDEIDPLPCCLQIAAALSFMAAHGGRYASARLAFQELLRS